jgi:hypothetical protein
MFLMLFLFRKLYGDLGRLLLGRSRDLVNDE